MISVTLQMAKPLAGLFHLRTVRLAGRAVTCEARNCQDAAEDFVKPAHPRTIELLGVSGRFFCASHARIEYKAKP